MYDNLRELRRLRLEIYVIQNFVALELREEWLKAT